MENTIQSSGIVPNAMASGIMSSDQIGKLSVALSKVQMELRKAKRDKKAYNYKYADIGECWDVCREPLAKNELAIIQLTNDKVSGRVNVVTILSHSSGQWIAGELSLRPKSDGPQEMGSALTYARRYGLMAMIGICPEDDDGRAAQPSTNSTNRPVTQAQLKRLYAIQQQSSWSEEDVKAFIRERFGCESSKDLTRDEYDIVCEELSR